MKPKKEITSGIALIFLAQNLLFPLGVQAAGPADTAPAPAQSKGEQLVGAIGGTLNKTLSTLPSMFGGSPSVPGLGGFNPQAAIAACGGTPATDKDVKALESNQKDTQDLVKKWSKALSKKKGKEDKQEEVPKSASNPKDGGCDKMPPDLKKDIPQTCDLIYGRLKHFTNGSEHNNVSEDLRNIDFLKDNKKDKEKLKGEVVDQKNKLKAYLTCKEGKLDELDKASLVYECQMNALSQAVQGAQASLSQSMMVNQSTFNDMNGHISEVQKQEDDVENVLGPDPKLGKLGASQHQGLIGMAKDLHENFPKLQEAEAKFSTDLDTLKNDTDTNEQNLEATRVSVASSCIKGTRNLGVSGGYSLTCFKPVQTVGKDGAATNVTDKNGNTKFSKQSCGPYDYIRSKIEQRAFITSRGVIMSQDRRDNAQANSAAFDSLVDSINRQMGDYDAATENKAKLDSDVHSWSDIESKVSANIDAVSSSSGVDVRSMLRSVATHCFQEADSWKNKQVRSSNSDYSKKKAEFKARQKKMTTDMNTAIAGVSKNYSDAVALLLHKVGNVNPSSCSNLSPDLMKGCFSNISDRVQGLLTGTGPFSAAVPISIKSYGKFSAPISGYSCSGIDTCLTVYTNIHTQLQTHIDQSKSARETFVNKSKEGTQTQMKFLAQNLSQLQNSIKAQYFHMKSLAHDSGVEIANKPDSIPGEALKPLEGPPPEKLQGPFDPQSNLTAALSGAMGADGLLDFQNKELGKVAENSATKKDELEAKIKEKTDSLDEILGYYENPSSCGAVDSSNPKLATDSGGEKVNSMTESCSDAAQKADACMIANKISDTRDQSLKEIFDLMSTVGSKLTEGQYNLLNAKSTQDAELAILGNNCKEEISLSRKCLDGGKAAGYVYDKDTASYSLPGR